MQSALMELIRQDDAALRRYARCKAADVGEDGYHDAVCGLMERTEDEEEIMNPSGFLRVAITRSIYKIFRHEKSEMTLTASYLAGDPPPGSQGLKMGRQRHAVCKRGHALIGYNVVQNGRGRTCRTCMRVSQAAYAKTRKRHRHQKEVTPC